jgi:hypothetical protein
MVVSYYNVEWHLQLKACCMARGGSSPFLKPTNKLHAIIAAPKVLCSIHAAACSLILSTNLLTCVP